MIGKESSRSLHTSIVEGVSVFLSLFDDNPKVKRVFCPKKECYDPRKNANNQFGKPLPSFSWLIENGSLAALNFPIGMNAGLAKALGVMMKLDFERAVLLSTAARAAECVVRSEGSSRAKCRGNVRLSRVLVRVPLRVIGYEVSPNAQQYPLRCLQLD
jgi:hypothetical protein